MQIINEQPEKGILTIDQSASVLGLNEFSLLSRIQAGDIKFARARSGQIVIPESELERLVRSPINTSFIPQTQSVDLSDDRLGIKKTFGGLKRSHGERAQFSVSGYDGRFTVSEINSYRASFGAIANDVEFVAKLKEQLNQPATVSESSEKKIVTPQIGQWQVRSTLLNLDQSDILLCQRGEHEFAVVERFRQDSPYARANGSAEILLQGNNAVQLAEDFKANAHHTLEFMASDLVAKAQKVAWWQFPDCRPAQVVAAVSARCRQAVSNQETISENLQMNHTVSRGMGI